MVGRGSVLTTAMVVLLSGCVSPNADVDSRIGAGGLLHAATTDGLVDSPYAAEDILHWQGQCSNGACPSYVLELTEASDEPLYLSAWWDYRPDDAESYAFEASWELPEGVTLASEHHDAFASVGVVNNPAPGTYSLTLTVADDRTGHQAFDVTAVLAAPAEPNADGDYLPDLVALEPAHLAIHVDGHVTTPDQGPPFPAVPVTGCQPAETAEQEAMRCLRFSSGFSNMGSGDLLAYLDNSNPANAHWVQIITTSDGQREHEAGAARLHALHMHYHYERALEATVYAYDLEAETRGAPVAASHKTGFCFEDWGLAPGVAPATDGGRYHCFDPDQPFPVALADTTVDPTMGVSAGWYDLYGWFLPDQYVDLTDIKDGIYELANVANPDGYLLESDDSNNEASVIFRLSGDDVEILRAGP